MSGGYKYKALKLCSSADLVAASRCQMTQWWHVATPHFQDWLITSQWNYQQLNFWFLFSSDWHPTMARR